MSASPCLAGNKDQVLVYSSTSNRTSFPPLVSSAINTSAAHNAGSVSTPFAVKAFPSKYLGPDIIAEAAGRLIRLVERLSLQPSASQQSDLGILPLELLRLPEDSDLATKAALNADFYFCYHLLREMWELAWVLSTTTL